MVKQREEPQREPKMVIAPRAQERAAESDSVRKKLCASLTSALEMVVSKQVVKSVLGVVNGDRDEMRQESQIKTEDAALLNGSLVREDRVWFSDGEDRNISKLSDGNESSVMDVDAKPGFGVKEEVKDEEPQDASSPNTSIRIRRREVESESSSSKKLKTDGEETVAGAQEAKGGLQLMEQAKKVACSVEFHLFSLNGGVNKKYKEKARSLLFNLKDKSNPELRVRVFSGEITPDILVRMPAEQLASKQLSQWRTAKAEEFASMVVLTDADVDPRRIVKKTHKGEFSVVVEEVDFSVTSEEVDLRKSYPVTGKEDEIDGTGGDTSSEKILEEIPLANDSPDLKASEAVDLANIEGIIPDSMLPETPVSLREGVTVERSNSLRARNGESTSYDGLISFTGREAVNATAIWEGSIQITATRFAPVDGFYERGEKLELKDWPKSLEIKGRVKLEALDKFLQDLQMSRSRTVTVISLCSSSGHGNEKQSAAYLKDMADQLRTGERSGFVEPMPGFELYLLAPDCPSLDILRDDLRSVEVTSKRKAEVLVGVVVWRKCQYQGILSRRSDQILKKTSLSNVLSESQTEVNAKPLRATNVSVLGEELFASRKTVSDPPLVSSSGNPSIHTGKSLSGMLTASNISGLKERLQLPAGSSGLQIPSLVSPRPNVPDNSHRSLANSGSQRHPSFEPVDAPPGFTPKVVPSFIPSVSSSLIVDRKDVGGFNVSGNWSGFPGSVSGQSSHVVDGRHNFGQNSSPTPISLNLGTPTPTQEEDLPEFDFEEEDVLQRTVGNFVPQGKQTKFVAPADHNVQKRPLGAPANHVLNRPNAASANQNVMSRPVAAPANHNVLNHPVAAPANHNLLNRPLAASANHSVLNRPLAAPTIHNVQSRPTGAPAYHNVISRTIAAPANHNVLNRSLVAPANQNVLIRPLVTPAQHHIMSRPGAAPAIRNVMNHPGAAPAIHNVMNHPVSGFQHRDDSAIHNAVNHPSTGFQHRDDSAIHNVMNHPVTGFQHRDDSTMHSVMNHPVNGFQHRDDSTKGFRIGSNALNHYSPPVKFHPPNGGFQLGNVSHYVNHPMPGTSTLNPIGDGWGIGELGHNQFRHLDSRSTFPFGKVDDRVPRFKETSNHVVNFRKEQGRFGNDNERVFGRFGKPPFH